MWAVLYDDGMSLTTASERVAQSLAEAERQRGHRVIVRRLDDVETRQPEPIRPAERLARSQPISEPGPAREASPPGLTREPGPARAATPARRRRFLLYALVAACIVVAAALVDHWGVLPRVGASTSSSPTQVGGPPSRSQLLPPLDQPPVVHFSNAVNATSTTGVSSGGGP